ncbi:MAG: AAA family ATPase, partial [Lachnospiraceae bacterium]|nr:AAA family ATPase [Lachnospiraceae bacterium]
MTKQDTLHLHIKSRFTDFLKAAELPYWEPALTVCPHCGEHAGILMDFMWSCQHCGKRGDVVDYVMALEHLDSKLAAIKRVCRALQIKVTTLEVISASDLMDMEFEPTNMLIDRLIGRGVYLIAGSPKIGKSWLMLWLAHCVSTGEKVWDFDTTKSDVLYISLEDPRERIQMRLAKVTGGETGHILFATEAELMGKGFEEQVISFLIENPTVKFVIVDTLQRVRQMRADQYSYAGDYEVISQMKSIADRFGITILL